MPALWNDLRLALTIIAFIFLVKWSTGVIDNKPLGIIIAAVIAYLTIFSHYELLILAVIFFFGYPVFQAFGEAMSEED